MRKFLVTILAILAINQSFSQTVINYEISFQNRVHHEAEVMLSFENTQDTLQLRMSRSSPGRYAIHEFAKNVYSVKAVDENGNTLALDRPNPYQWDLVGHKGKVTVTYTLFADRGDGTYSQIDETHAHLNIPSTFMFARGYEDHPVSLKVDIPKNSNWKVATQLKKEGASYTAPNFQYFMDSPVEVSDHMVRQFDVESNNNTYTINMALHHMGTESEADEYFEKVKSVVLEEIEVFGALPEFDFNEYTFLLCYMPNVSGDGMEHRNSTICTSTRSLAEGGMDRNIGTISHEFFHAWNVERIRPESLEPFNFEQANMSGELWFAEGFTSYYTGLILARAGLASDEDYVSSIARNFNYVVNSKGRNYFNPIEMSYQAPFVDAAASIDPVNRGNTFISYYSYGSILGLALDLSLRKEFKNLNLDGYMKMVWEYYGKNENPYTIENLKETLAKYSNENFSFEYFNNYVYMSQLPDFEDLFGNMGISMISEGKADFGAYVIRKDENWEVYGYAEVGGSAYQGGLENGDVLLSIGDHDLTNVDNFNDLLKEFKPGDSVDVTYSRRGEHLITTLVLQKDPTVKIVLNESVEKEVTDEMLSNRNNWLHK